MSKTKTTTSKKQDVLATITSEMFKYISPKKTTDPVTKNLYSFLPRSDYFLSLVAVESDKEGVIQVSDKNEKEVISRLNTIYKDSKKLTLFFVSAMALSQEVVVESKKLGGNVKIKNLGAVMSYNWKERIWTCAYLGFNELNQKERELVEWKFDRGLVRFAEENSIRYIKTSVKPE